ncbi:MAG: hypothetical protein GF334_08430, partial [Candidatus Altiarchaeales archaeon]|nr:hypothetical protein [Candidatus Altiarchaeales archaeon]
MRCPLYAWVSDVRRLIRPRKDDAVEVEGGGKYLRRLRNHLYDMFVAVVGRSLLVVEV